MQCDEKLPSCSPCERARVACSGPPTQFRFVHDGYHTSPSSSHYSSASLGSDPISTSSNHSFKPIDTQRLNTGAFISRFRLSSHHTPPRNLTTVADRVAARLVGYLTTDGADRDFLTSVGYMQHLPPRIERSAALRDCVALVRSSWGNFKRDMSAKEVLDLAIYGKALRSLHRAVEVIGDRGVDVETLAAATVMERFEVVFDVARPYHRARHSMGIVGLMKARGPPNLNDPLDVQLAIENHGALVGCDS